MSVKRLIYGNCRQLSTYSTLLYITLVTLVVILLSVLVINSLDANFINKYYNYNYHPPSPSLDLANSSYDLLNNYNLLDTYGSDGSSSGSSGGSDGPKVLDDSFVVRHNEQAIKAKVIIANLPTGVTKQSPKLNQRLWFLTNGTGRLTPKESVKLALWPEESRDPADDRIVNQLLYVPYGYQDQKSQPNGKHKTIYLSASDNDWRLALGRKEFLRCPVSTCQLVPKSQSQNADLIFFKSRYSFGDFEANRNPKQIWAKFEIESPSNIQLLGPDGAINWTATYRHDSEIPTPYYKYYPYESGGHRSITRPAAAAQALVNYALNKTKKVVWFVSNCYANNKRLEYAKQLSKYIQVDIYGRCGTHECSKSDNDMCQQMLDKDYKFYLSFENSNCMDYITEKFWINGLMHNIVPIVMGAHPSTYKRLAPPHSYIHVDDYESPRLLAQYLHELDTNDRLYNQYFGWKGTGDLREIFMWCRVCALLHAPPKPRYYQSLQDWWVNDKTCVPITWTNMIIE